MPAGYIRRRGGFWGGTPRQQTTKLAPIVAPVGGINAVTPLAAMEPTYCLEAVNLVADGPGLRVRPGYAAYATSVGTGGIRTVIPFEGTTESKLFVSAQDGIYDVSAGGSGPWTADVTFGDGTGDAGIGVWTNFVSDAGTHYCFYAEDTNGLFRYAESGTWAPVTDITGVTETDLCFVMQHMGRVWFVETGTATGWYLATGAISGAATPFNFGNKFRHGGELVGLYSWTVDGGDGVNDHLVAIGSGGDVMVYSGTDPSSVATWSLVGQWYVGALPAGRRVANNEAGDLFIISQYGVIPLTKLMQGQLVQQEATQLSRNIAPLVADAMLLTRSTLGWELRNVPGENVFLLNRPQLTGFQNVQFCLSTRTYGWTQFQGLPYYTGDTWDGEFYFGDTAGTVYLMGGDTDDGEAIQFSMLSCFQEFGESGIYHRVQALRPVFRASGGPAYNVAARYDYDYSPTVNLSPPSISSGALWDSAVWDTAVWGGGLSPFQSVIGGSNIGRAIAVAVAGSSVTPTTLLRIDVMFDSGGFL